MPESRIEVADYGEFNPREWLRREALWGYLMAPYSIQMECWVNETERAYHDGNFSRQDLYDIEGDTEAQSLSFFNQGKGVSSIISSATLFSACMSKSGEGAHVDILGIQAKFVDKALEYVADTPMEIEADEEDKAYRECTRLAKLVSKDRPDQFGNQQRLLRASKIMSSLATKKADLWLARSEQDSERSLATLTINNGGHPRSYGPRVNMLQPIFHRIVGSEQYQAFTVD